MSKKRRKKLSKIDFKLPLDKTIRLTKKQFLEGAKSFLEGESSRILDRIKERKNLEKDSERYKELTFEINTLVKSYNRTARLHKLPEI